MFIKEAIEQFKQRQIISLIDDSAPSPRAILVSPAETLTFETLNQILSLARGLTYVALSPTRAQAFELSRMSGARSAVGMTNKIDRDDLVSVEAREGVSTGISVADRLTTIRILGEATPNKRKLVSPGHIFPVATRQGGVLVKSSRAEAALDLVSIAGFTEAALFVDMLDHSGAILPISEVAKCCQETNIPVLTLSEVIRYRLEHEQLVSRLAESKLPTQLAGEMRSYIYRSNLHDGEHLALVKGSIDPTQPVLTRVQAECTFSDVFGGGTPATRSTLHRCLEAIGNQGSGVLLYLRRPDSGQLGAQISAAAHAEEITRPAAIMREYGLGAQILHDLGVRKIELLTNSKNNLVGIKSFGIEIVSTRPIPE